jgi:hypothetical protein
MGKPTVFIIVPEAEPSGILALGRAWTLLGSRENPKPEKCL